MAKLGGSHGQEAFSFPALTQSGCLSGSSEFLPSNQLLVGNKKVQGDLGPLPVVVGPQFLAEGQGQTPTFSLQESPPRWLPRPAQETPAPPRAGETVVRRGGRGEQRFFIPALLPLPETQLSPQPRLSTQAALPARGSQKGCSPGRGRSSHPRSN